MIAGFILLLGVGIGQKNGQKIIPIVMGTDNGFIGPTIVAITSLFENGHANTFYQLNLLIPGNFESESKETLDSLEQKYRNNEINLIDMGDKYKDAPVKWVTTATYYRLDSPSLFPDLTKCIFLDGDVMVRQDLSEMYDINVDNYYVAGVVEACVWYKRNPPGDVNKKKRLLEVSDLDQYINTGVMIMNLKNMRENNVEEKFSKFIKEKGHILRTGKYTNAEQDVFNSVCHGRILSLPYEYNYLINFISYFPKDLENPIIVHFAGVLKPWSHPEQTGFYQEWWDYARKTGVSVFPQKIGGRRRKRIMRKKRIIRRRRR